MSERTLRKLERRIAPGPVERYFKTLNPIKALGDKANGDFYEYQFTISIIMLFSLIIAIIATLMFNNTHDEKTREKQLIVAVMSISWFVFANFTFLVFEGTRLFNILLFTSLMVMTILVTINLEDNMPAKNMGISIIALSAFPLIVLLYYYLTSEKDEVTQLKTIERERRRKAEFVSIQSQYERKLRAEIKKELEEDVSTETGVKNRVAAAYIDALIDNAKQNIKVNINPKKEDGKKKKGKEDKDKGEKEKDE